VLFSIFIDDLILKVIKTNVGCHIYNNCVSIFLFADDILLLSPTITGLQSLFNTCERELEKLDMRVNAAKSMCIRFGQRFDAPCVELTSIHGDSLKWVSKCRYLGVYFTSGRSFRCSYDSAKSRFFRAFNAIYSKVGRTASEETVIALLRSKCLPVLLYATEACPLLVRDQRSLEFTVTRVFMKIFRTGSSTVITDCQRNFNFLSIQRQLLIRTAKFLQAFAASENHICLLFNSNATHQLNIILSSVSVTTTGQLINVMYDQLYCTQ